MTTSPHIVLAAAIDLPAGQDAPDWVHLLPAASGPVRTFDGRGPYHVGDAAALIAASMADPRGLPIDENRAADLAAPKGGQSPARGWITEMQARDDGISGRVEWTRAGRELVADPAYRGISPVFHLADDRRTVRSIPRASLVNQPNLRGHTALHTEMSMDMLKRLRIYSPAVEIAEDLRDHVLAQSRRSIRRIASNLSTVQDAARIKGLARMTLSDARDITFFTGEAPRPRRDEIDQSAAAGAPLRAPRAPASMRAVK